jgi:hypothetical protein
MAGLIVVLVAFAWLPSASAGQIHKCVAADGRRIVQSIPCPTDQKTEWSRDIVAEPARASTFGPTAEPPRRSSERAVRQPRPRAHAPAAETPGRRKRQRMACSRAREQETAYRRQHPAADYDTLTALHDRTAAACRGL